MMMIMMMMIVDDDDDDDEDDDDYDGDSRMKLIIPSCYLAMLR